MLCTPMTTRVLALALSASLPLACLASPEAQQQAVQSKLNADYPRLESLYKELHARPELSEVEFRTAARMAAELREAGFEVTEKVGGNGLVCVLRNGPGPVLLYRTDMDALPVKEDTGLPYASTARCVDRDGKEQPAMHACGHDLHMSVWVGAARALASLRPEWSGTLVFIAEPSEEVGLGARELIGAGLYSRFPKPDFALSLHDTSTLPAGTVGTIEGFMMANVDTAEIRVRGLGGHGAYPHTTKDPVVLAARIVMALQTITSRETRPIEPCVVTVGSIHGGTKSNIIPDEVVLQLTLRSYSDKVRLHTIEAIRRICQGEAIAAGMPEDRFPLVSVAEREFTPALYNTPDFCRRVRTSLETWIGTANTRTIEAEMGGEDFSEYGRTEEKVPITMFRLGVSDPAKFEESLRTGIPLPSPHSPRFAPVVEPSIRTGVTSVVGTALDLLRKR